MRKQSFWVSAELAEALTKMHRRVNEKLQKIAAYINAKFLKSSPRKFCCIWKIPPSGIT